MPAQLANESFRADHVRFGNSVGAVVQVLMRSDVPTAEAFFRDHLGSEALWYEAAILGVAYSLIRGTYREIRIEKIDKPNAVSLGRESQQAAVGIERIASSRFQKLEAAFLSAINQIGCWSDYLRSCRWVCRRVGIRRAAERRNRSPRYLRETRPHALYLPE